MPQPTTYLITQQQVREILNIAEAVRVVERAFGDYGEGRVQMPPKPYLHFEEGDLRCMPAYVPELGLASVKNVNVHPGNTDLPTVMATVTVVDPDTGFPLAVMDGTWLTAMRTGAAGGIAAAHLCREDAATAGIIGAGRQAETQLEALLAVRSGIETVLLSDVRSERAEEFARWVREQFGLQAAAATAEETVRRADVLITVTPVREPIVRAEWVQFGTHINAIGADAPGKQELDAEILQVGKVVVDSWEQASHGGEINVAVSEGIVDREHVHADIGEVVAGKKPGRENAEEVTVFDSTGLAIQDCACAALVYRKLVEEGDTDRLQKIDFLSRSS